jgi:dephospho-CoA kinase
MMGRFIGVVGQNCSGKDTVAEILESLGFQHRSLSKIIRDEATRLGMTQEREGLITLANELRKKDGPAVLAEMTIKELNTQQDWVFSSIRHPKEVDILRTLEGFELWNVTASVKTRYERWVKRGDAEISFDRFRELEAKENQTSGDAVQRIGDVEALADKTIINEGTLEDLREQVEELV